MEIVDSFTHVLDCQQESDHMGASHSLKPNHFHVVSCADRTARKASMQAVIPVAGLRITVCHTHRLCANGEFTAGFPYGSCASTKKLDGSCAGALPVAGPNARILLGSGGPARMYAQLGNK